MKTETNHEAEFVIHFDFFSGEEQTFDYPGSPAHVEITKVSLYGTELNKEQTKAFIDDYGLHHLDNVCFDAVEEEREKQTEMRAEYAYKAWLESFKPCPF